MELNYGHVFQKDGENVLQIDTDPFVEKNRNLRNHEFQLFSWERHYGYQEPNSFIIDFFQVKKHLIPNKRFHFTLILYHFFLYGLASMYHSLLLFDTNLSNTSFLNMLLWKYIKLFS